jgi:hypothetical protein
MTRSFTASAWGCWIAAALRRAAVQFFSTPKCLGDTLSERMLLFGSMYLNHDGSPVGVPVIL